MPTFSPKRAAAVMLVLIFGLAGMSARVAYLQTYGRARIINWADRQQHITEKLVSRRGSIYDANGCLMAGTIQTKNLYVDPKFMHECFQTDGKNLGEMDEAVKRLARLLDKEPFALAQQLAEKYESRYLRIAENLDDKACAEIEKLNIPGVGFETQNQRFYPMGSIASHILGGVGRDDTGLAEKGLEGVELKFNKELAGRDGSQRVLKDARRRAIAVAAEDYFPPQHGQHLILTLDANVQMIAEQELSHVCADFKANRGECIVIDPRSGDILAMANWPSFNPQMLEDSTQEVRRNRCLTDPYEPGSTFKPFIAGPALREKVTKVGEVFPIHGPHFTTSYGRKVTDVHGYDQLALWDVLVKSSNIGMCMLGQKMGNQRIYNAIRSFGFGQRSGVDLPGEDPGLVNPLRKWTKYSTESVSQGYEVMVTPMQLARAFCAYANGGRLVTPRIVKGTLEADGSVAKRYENDGLQLMPRAIDPNTSAEVRRVLADVVVRGTATKARSKVWNIFGKTGTAHVSSGKGGYSDSKYTSSFMAGAPFEDPRVVVVMIIHEPDKAAAQAKGLMHYGGAVAAPGAARVIERTLAYFAVQPSRDLPLPPPQVAGVLYNYNEKLYKIGTVTASARE
jgi:cell division protein FtsI/penicillin-binding protein 2